MFFEWSSTYFVIQVVAGFVGAHVAALVAHEHRFGFIGHSAVGLIMGRVQRFLSAKHRDDDGHRNRRRDPDHAATGGYLPGHNRPRRRRHGHAGGRVSLS
jgi:hypothetical protein